MCFAVKEEDSLTCFFGGLGEVGCAVDAKDGCVAWRVDECLRRPALYRVLHAVEWEFSSKEFEVFVGCGPRDEGLVI